MMGELGAAGRSAPFSGRALVQGLLDRLRVLATSAPFRWAALCSVMVALCHVQWRLYSGNQHTYLLHALAPWLGKGLRHDWLTQTADPQPVFSFVIGWSHHLFGAQVVYAWMGLLTVVYAGSLWSLCYQTWRPRNLAGFVLGFACVVALHAGLEGRTQKLLFHGFAVQYLLAEVLQPAVFGVFLLLALACAVARRPFWTAFGLVVASTFHPTYVAHSLWLLLGISIEWIVRSRAGAERPSWMQSLRPSSILVGLTLVGMAPIVFYSARTFGSAPEQLANEAACIIADQRIAHHTQLRKWLTPEVLLQVAIWLGLAGVLSRQALGKYLLWLAVTGVGFTVMLSIYPSCRLALLFPQRASVVAIPVTTTLLITGTGVLLGYGVSRWRDRALTTLSLLVLTWSGIYGYREWQVGAVGPDPLVAAIKRHVPEAGTIFLVPPSLREDLRLSTGRSLVVDYKSHPYKPDEVVEWRERRTLADAVARVPSGPSIERAAVRYGATHVLAPAGWRMPAGYGERVYRDGRTQLFKLTTPALAPAEAKAPAPATVEGQRP